MPSLFEFRSSAIAKQMTYLDAELFQKIEVTAVFRSNYKIY